MSYIWIMENYSEILRRQRLFFEQGNTLDTDFRIAALKRMRQTVLSKQDKIADALAKDLNKCGTEAFLTETGMLVSSINYTIRHLKKWARPRRAHTPLSLFPSKSTIVPSPYGVCLIAAPWNYPVLLALDPLVSAVAAGNCAIVKPSETAPASSAVIKEIISETFHPGHVYATEGGPEEINALTDLHFDSIFFTGSPEKGKLVMRKAAEHLTPVTLELGGKSPCIIDESADLRIAIRRVAFGKILNAGQTCVAPDYLLVHASHRERIADEFANQIKSMTGGNPLDDKTYPKIINTRHFERIVSYLKQGEILYGGTYRTDNLTICPTLLEIGKIHVPVMEEEIFGPVLPVLFFQDIEDAIHIIRQLPNPLALYIFTSDKQNEKTVLEKLSFGGACVNDCIMHIASPALPFGGTGNSGMGYSHGKYGFDGFSHMKSIMSTPVRPDIPLRYRPYGKVKDWLIRIALG